MFFIRFKSINLKRALIVVRFFATFSNTGNMITLRNNYTCIIVYCNGGLHELLPIYKTLAPQ